MTRPPLLPLAALLALWPLAGHAQLDAERLALSQRRVESPIVQIPGRSGRPDRAYFRDGVSETTYYSSTDKAEVRVEISGPRNGTGPTLSMTRPTETGIRAELAREFPGETMLVVRTPLRNAYGPIGMATGERCLYAWQWIETLHRTPDAGDRLFASSGTHPASLRVRLCRRPGESMAGLAASVQRLSLRDPLSQGAPRPAPRPRTASPRPAADVQAAAPAPQVLTRAPARPAPEPIAPMPAPVRSAPAGGYAAVPLPSSAQPVGQRPFVTTIDRGATPQPERPPAAPQPVPVPVPVPSASTPPVPVPVGGGESRRYITDQATGEGPATIVPRPARPGLSNTDEPFTGSLPAEAYRGPGR